MGSPGSAQVTRCRLLERFPDLVAETIGATLILRRAAELPEQPEQRLQPRKSSESTPANDLIDRLSRLGEMTERGLLTTEEFEVLKSKLLEELRRAD